MAKDANSVISIIGRCVRNPCWMCLNCETENSNASLRCEICGSEKSDILPMHYDDNESDETIAYVNPKSVPKIVKSPKMPYPDAANGVWDKVVDWFQKHPLVPTVAALLLLFLMVYLLSGK